MSRLVIGVHPDIERGGFLLIVYEPSSNDGWTPRRFAYRPDDPVPTSFRDGTSETSEMGAYLAQGLRAHPAISQELDHLLAAAPDAAPNPVYIRLSAEAEVVPWETLFDHDEFLALDRRWPVARMGSDAASTAPIVFEPPLRVMAVLGAANVPAADEWTALFEALRHAPYPVTIRALVAEPELEATIRATEDPKVTITVAGVPPGRDVLDEIADFRPHLLHVFSHGRVNHGFPEIQIATRSSWPNDDDPGHVVLEPKSFASVTAIATPWVVTMNVCRGAAASDTGSLVYALLSIGFPAVVGMREPVGERVAHAFTKGFYRSLARMIGQARPDGGRTDLELALALQEARLEICEALRDAASCRESASHQREWALPVLYVRGPGLAIERRERSQQPPAGVEELAPGAAAPPSRGEAETYVAFLRDVLAANLPEMDGRAQASIQAEVERVEASLYAQPPHVPA